MAGPTTQPSLNLDTELTIKAIENLTSNHELADDDKNPGQVPLSLSVKGVPFLRGRDIPYKVER
mgnify:CR=1 FL=1